MNLRVSTWAGYVSFFSISYGISIIFGVLIAKVFLGKEDIPPTSKRNGLKKSNHNQRMYQITLTKLFSSMVWPILRYTVVKFGTDSSEVFKSKIFKLSNNDVEKLHLKFCKRLSGVHSKVTFLAVYSDWEGCLKYPNITRICPTFDNTSVDKARDICYTKLCSVVYHTFVKDMQYKNEWL